MRASDGGRAQSRPPALRTKRMLLVATGSISAAYLPSHLIWLRSWYPDLDIQVVVTRSARRFVSAEALGVLSGRELHHDVWGDGEDAAQPKHVEWWMWADSVLVYPATMHFLARLALGMADTPALLALQCTGSPVVVAPALPPGGWESEVMVRHVKSLRERSNIEVVPPVRGMSITTREKNGWLAAPLNVVLRELAGDQGDSEEGSTACR